MTKKAFKSHGDPLDYRDMHILTYAEEGFSPLGIHGRKLGVSREMLDPFVNAVNQANEVGSLHPQAPISAVPRSCIRDTTDPAILLGHLQEFMTANVDHIKARRLLIDFSTPRLQPHAQKAIAQIFAGPSANQIEEITVIRN